MTTASTATTDEMIVLARTLAASLQKLTEVRLLFGTPWHVLSAGYETQLWQRSSEQYSVSGVAPRSSWCSRRQTRSTG